MFTRSYRVKIKSGRNTIRSVINESGRNFSWYLGKKETQKALEQILTMFELLDGHPLDCRQALQSDMPDYEDALIAFAARRQEVDFIVTRNKKDFANSPVPALTPGEFVELFKPGSTSYAEFDIPQDAVGTRTAG